MKPSEQFAESAAKRLARLEKTSFVVRPGYLYVALSLVGGIFLVTMTVIAAKAGVLLASEVGGAVICLIGFAALMAYLLIKAFGMDK
jgi:hypothetical protein